MKLKKRIILIAIFSAALAFAYFFSGGKNAEQAEKEDANNSPEISFFSELNLQAKSACVFDAGKGTFIYELNGIGQLPLASLTKIMTAVTAKENIFDGALLEIDPVSLQEEGDNGFLAGEKWNVNDIIASMIVSSSNDAAAVLSKAVSGDENDFVKLMNQKTEELGLSQSFYLNATGLDVSKNVAGAYGSAKDTAKLLAFGFKKYPSLFAVTAYDETEIKSRLFKNTNKLAGVLPGLLAGKTGFTDLADGNLAIVADMGFYHPVVIVVLGSTEEGRFEDVKKLYDETIKYFSSQ